MASFPKRPPHSLQFYGSKLGAWLDRATSDDLDALEFGVIEVDDNGTVIFYNRYESGFTGLAPETVIGRSFFTDVAPCTNNPLFYGRFRRALDDEEYDTSLRYTLTYRLRPTLVNVRILRYNERNWILVAPNTTRDTPGTPPSISRHHRFSSLQG